MLLIVSLMLVVALAAATAFGDEAKPQATGFNYFLGIVTPGVTTPIQFTGGKFPDKALGDASKPVGFNYFLGIVTPGVTTPIQFTGGKFPDKALGDASKPAGFNYFLGIVTPGVTTPIQFTGGKGLL